MIDQTFVNRLTKNSKRNSKILQEIVITPNIDKIERVINSLSKVRDLATHSNRSIGSVKVKLTLNRDINILSGVRDALSDEGMSNKKFKKLVLHVSSSLMEMREGVLKHVNNIPKTINLIENELPPWEMPKFPKGLTFSEFKSLDKNITTYLDQRGQLIKDQLEKPENLETTNVLSKLQESTLNKMQLRMKDHNDQVRKALKKLKAPYKLLKLPVMAYTKPVVIPRSELDKLSFGTFETYPGIIFDNQVVIALEKDIKFNLEELQKRYRFLKKRNYINVLFDEKISSRLNKKYNFFWLMPKSDYNIMGRPIFKKSFFPIIDRNKNSNTVVKRESGNKLLSRLPASDAIIKDYMLINLPITVTFQSEPIIPKSLYSYIKLTKDFGKTYTFHKQTLVIVNKNDYTSAYLRVIMEKAIAKLSEKINDDFVAPLDRLGLTTTYTPNFVYMWIIPKKVYSQFRMPNFISANLALPKAPEIVDSKTQMIRNQSEELQKQIYSYTKNLIWKKNIWKKRYLKVSAEINNVEIVIDQLKKSIDNIKKDVSTNSNYNWQLILKSELENTQKSLIRKTKSLENLLLKKIAFNSAMLILNKIIKNESERVRLRLIKKYHNNV